MGLFPKRLSMTALPRYEDRSRRKGSVRVRTSISQHAGPDGARCTEVTLALFSHAAMQCRTWYRMLWKKDLHYAWPIGETCLTFELLPRSAPPLFVQELVYTDVIGSDTTDRPKDTVTPQACSEYQALHIHIWRHHVCRVRAPWRCHHVEGSGARSDL